MKKIDCHTHIVNEHIKEEYFLRTNGYAIVMQFLEKFSDKIGPDDSFLTVYKDKRLFLCPCIDISAEIQPQLDEIERYINDNRIVGLKIYLTYQTGRADDERLLCVYRFAQKHHLSVTFHNGLCSLVLPSDNDMEGSNAIYVARVAEQFPDVNFVIAHMDDPRFENCIQLVHSHNNIFTDFSGAYEPGTKEDADIEGAIKTFAKAINQYPDTYKKILYGTDFCPPINLFAIEEYDYTIKKIFSPEQFEDIYFNNSLRAFPKLKKYIYESNIERIK